jgi:plasmid stabilization system protein ParE
VAKVEIATAALEDLKELAAFIESRSDRATADGYLERLYRRIAALEIMRLRGGRPSRRQYQAIGFEQRATILYRRLRDRVLVVSVLYGGRLR